MKTLPNIIEKGSCAYQRKRCPRTHHRERDPRFKRSLVGPSAEPELFVRNGYRAALCEGEAHSNAHIDNCMHCAPMWGVAAVKVSQ